MPTKLTRQLQISVILPYQACPEWQLRLLERLRDSDDFAVSAFGLEVPAVRWSAARWLFDHWRRLDARIFSNDSLAAGQRGHEEGLCDVSEQKSAFRQSFRTVEELVKATRDQSADVILWLSSGTPPYQLSGNATLGVWWLSNIENDAAGFWELTGGIPVVSCDLFVSEPGPARHRTLGRAFAKTDNLSLTRTLRRLRAIDESLVVLKLREALRKGEITVTLPRRVHKATVRQGRPGIIRLVGATGLLYGRYLLNYVIGRFRRDQWQLAYRVGGERLSQEGLVRLAPCDGGFWADPFVIHRENRTIIFFEEFEAKTSKGRIVALEIAEDGSVGPLTVVLDCEYHLSYPFIFEHEDSLYMIPEGADSGRVEAFRCVEFPYRWEAHSVLLDNIRAFDATLVQHGGQWWMFAAVQHNGNTTCDELHLFHAEGPFEQWTPHSANPIVLDIHCARPGGAFYLKDGQLYRPAQDCSERYGYGLSIQRVVRLDLDGYDEETVCQIAPDWTEDIRGTHTVNQANGITVYDCLARVRK